MPFIAKYNLFSSANWRTEYNSAWDGVGEVWNADRPWVNGAAPAEFPAVCPCGTDSQWRNGDPGPGSSPLVPDDWIVPCCVPPDFCDVPSWTLDLTFWSGRPAPFIVPDSAALLSLGGCSWEELIVGNRAITLNHDGGSPDIATIDFVDLTGAIPVLVATASLPVDRVSTGTCRSTDLLIVPRFGGVSNPGDFVRLNANPV